MSWDVRFSIHASAKRGNNSQQSWTTINCAITVLAIHSCHRMSVEHTREYFDILCILSVDEPIVMPGYARYVVVVYVIQTIRCCDDRGNVEVSNALRLLVTHGLPRAAQDTCQYMTQLQLWNDSRGAHCYYHTRTANSPTEWHPSTSWQLTGSIWLLSHRPLHTL